MSTLDQHLDRFMRDSNQIEGETEVVIAGGVRAETPWGRLNPGDLEAARRAVKGSWDDPEKMILELHGILGRHLEEPWVGRYRDCSVRVGRHIPPGPHLVPHLMHNFCLDFATFDAWEAYNRFEHIHPCEDLNGRTGRLIWLAKMRERGWAFERTFLEQYHSDTLAHFRPS